jgi:hypothetical protein
VTFPAARARQLWALEEYRASAPEARQPGGAARRMLAREGVHFLHRAEIWAEALSAGLKEVGIGYMGHAGCQQLVASTIRPTRVVTPGCHQIGYMDHTGCHQLVL